MSSSTTIPAPLAGSWADELDRQIAELQPAVDPEREERVARAKGDLAFFGRTYFPHLAQAAFAPFHRETWRRSGAAEAQANDDLTVAPREHAKTTALTMIPLAHRIVFGRERFVLYLSETDDLAADRVRQIRHELETNRRLRADFGDLVGKRIWREGFLITATGIWIAALGTGSQLRGRISETGARPTLIVADDIENDEHVTSERQRDKTQRWFERVVVNLLGKGGRIWIRGTIIHHQCLLKKLLDEKRFPGKLYRAVSDTGKLLWPAWWDRPRLERRRQKIGSVAFEQEFQQNALDPTTQQFKREWFDRFVSGQQPDGLALYLGVDPAISLSEKAAKFATVLVGCRPKEIWVLNGTRDRLTFRQQLKKLLASVRLDKPIAVGVEDVAYQKVLAEQLAEEADLEMLWPNVVPVPTGGLKKEVRVGKLSPVAERGVIRVAAHLDWLVDDLEMYPQGGLDGPDALWIAVEVSKTSGPMEFASTGTRSFGGQMAAY